jgi:hypothetical protein
MPRKKEKKRRISQLALSEAERGLRGFLFTTKGLSSELLISEFSFFTFCVVFSDTTYAYSVFADFGQRVQLGK